MSALVERIIAARDMIKPLADYRVPPAIDALADAANAIVERDETIHALRQRLAKFEAFSAVEFQNCAIHVEQAQTSFDAANFGRELARMVRRLAAQPPSNRHTPQG